MGKEYRDLIIRQSIKDGFFHLGESMDEVIKIPDIDGNDDDFVIEMAEDIGDILMPFIESNLSIFHLEYAAVLGEDDLFDVIGHYILEDVVGPKTAAKYGDGAKYIARGAAKARKFKARAKVMGGYADTASGFGKRHLASAGTKAGHALDMAKTGGISGLYGGAWRGALAGAQGAVGLGAKIGAGMLRARQDYLRSAGDSRLAGGFAKASRFKRQQAIRDQEAKERAERNRIRTLKSAGAI